MFNGRRTLTFSYFQGRIFTEAIGFDRLTALRIPLTSDIDAKGVIEMKQHKFWAWAAVGCFVLAMYTGYKRK